MAEFTRASSVDDPAGIGPWPDQRPVMDEIRQLIAEGRRFASAELAYQAARAKLMGKAAGWIAAGGALAAVLMFFVLMALVMGLLLALAPLVGPWGAMGVVVGGLLVATAIAALVAWRGLRNFMDLLHDGEDPA